MRNKDHFVMIFWFIVFLCVFGAAFNVFLVIYMPQEQSVKMADTGLMFWLSTAVSGGIGYLIGSSAKVQASGMDSNSSITENTKTERTVKTIDAKQPDGPTDVKVVNDNPIVVKTEDKPE